MFLLLILSLPIAVVTSGDGSPQPTIWRQPGAAQRTHTLLAGIPQRGSILGHRTAPVTLQFFGDLQCKESRQVMLGALPFLIRRFVRAGTLQIRFRSLETDTQAAGGWNEFVEQQSAALAAGAQDKLWNFIDVFYRDQGAEFVGYVDEAFLDQIAQEAGLDMERWEKALRHNWWPQIAGEEALARQKRLNNTPSFLIGPTDGTARPLLHFGLEEPGAFEEAVEGLL